MHGVPEQLKSLCDAGDLCIVAFLRFDEQHEARVGALKTMAKNYEGSSIKFFWLERGSDIDCENALRISYLKNPVIAFAGSENNFVTMQTELSANALQDFVY